ncbi:hypothetical protein TWF718_010808 [Orbilia javanica]|uniref:BTB domain-containing protein n=1 Tax=Orbilia javanica TaxID=47235 RepID=A0AAN8MQX2_9PEZI
MTSTYEYERSPYFSYSSPDVVLVVGDGENKTTVSTHESIIGPPSGFFKAALKIGLKETHERKIDLPEITWLGMEEVLNWLYRKEVWQPKPREVFSEQTTEKFLAIFATIDFLQIPQLREDYEKMLDGLLKNLNESSRLLDSRDQGGRLAQIIHELYRIGGCIDDTLFLALLRLLKTSKNPLSVGMSGFYGFRNFVYKLEDPNPKFLHHLCNAYGFY